MSARSHRNRRPKISWSQLRKSVQHRLKRHRKPSPRRGPTWQSAHTPPPAGRGRDAARASGTRPRQPLPRLRRRSAAGWRGRQRDARSDCRPAEGRADRPAQDVLPPLRADGAVARTPAAFVGQTTLTPGSMAGAGLPAHVPVSKFDDHLPLYRQSEIFARMGADIPDSTLVDWCGRAMQPLIERIDAAVLAGDLLHADGRPIRVPDRSLRGCGLGKGVKKGRIRACVRDRRPCSGMAPAWHRRLPVTSRRTGRKNTPAITCEGSRGILQADG